MEKKVSKANNGTTIGGISLIIWSFLAVLSVNLKNIPIFELCSIASLTGFITASITNTYLNIWKNIPHHPKYVWIIGLIGICINDIFYFSSFKHAPAVQVDLINYTWPIIITLLTAITNKKPPTFQGLFALIIAFTGIYILLTNNKSKNFLEICHLKGYILAFLAAFSWAAYVTASKQYGKTKTEMIAVYNFFGIIFSITMHLKYEVFVKPNTVELLSAIMIGSFSHCFAYMFWDYGIKKGNDKLLNTLVYTIPIVSVSLLIVTKHAHYNNKILIATVLVTIAGIIQNQDDKAQRNAINA